MKALSNRIILKKLTKDDTVVKNGIFIPNSAIENSKLCEAEIVSIGPKCKLGFSIKTVVLYDKYAINNIDDTFGVLTEDNIILAES